MSTELAVVTPSGVDTYRASTDAAGMCRQIVVASAKSIQGRKFVCVEGWQAIAIAHGCAASARAVEVTEDGVRAIGEVRRMADGIVIAEAEGFVGRDEPTWFGGGPKKLPKRADYAIRAMAQTRAISRACRSAFAHVVVMMNAGLSTTPAEEMEAIDEPRAAPAAAPRQSTSAALDEFSPAAPKQQQSAAPAKIDLPQALQAKAKALATALRQAETVAAVNDAVMDASYDLGKIKEANADAYGWLMDLATRRERETAEAETDAMA